MSQSSDDLFLGLFVLEAANNHWGSVDRGLAIVREYGEVVRFNNVRAAIKLQIRDVENFIHADFRGRGDIRYIAKTEATRLQFAEMKRLVDEIRRVGCIPMATPFDEESVATCERLELPILKVASSDVNDWPLLERVAESRRPVIISTGGASEKSIDDVVSFFERRSIPLAINHCVSLYPSEDSDLQLNQIDYLRTRYPGHVIGLSSHEYNDWQASMHISYAKGARTWERHVDIDRDDVPVSPYCSLPEQVDVWFRAYHKAVEMSGGSGESRRPIPVAESNYLNALVRGVYARRDLEQGLELTKESFAQNFYLAVPLLRGQLSSREVMTGERLRQPLQKDRPLLVTDIDGPYSRSESMRRHILARGQDRE